MSDVKNTPTPRADYAERETGRFGGPFQCVPASFARKPERENTKLRGLLKNTKAKIQEAITEARCLEANTDALCDTTLTPIVRAISEFQ